MTTELLQEKSYVADLRPEGEDLDPVTFEVYRTGSESQPWGVSSDLGNTTHETLDQALFWELIMGGRHISETLRRQIHEDFGEPFPQ